MLRQTPPEVHVRIESGRLWCGRLEMAGYTLTFRTSQGSTRTSQGSTGPGSFPRSKVVLKRGLRDRKFLATQHTERVGVKHSMRSELCIVDWCEKGSIYVWVQGHSFSRSAKVRKLGREAFVKRSVRQSNGLILDYDAEGHLFGIEILNVPARLSERRRGDDSGAILAPQPPQQTTPT
jgi:Protein of unknown function (DUF2283)